MADQPDWISGSQSVITTVQVFNAAVLNPPGDSVTINEDLSSYASIYLVISGMASPCAINYAWADTTGFIILGRGVIYNNAVGGSVQANLITKGAQLTLTFSAITLGDPITISVIGSNLVLAGDAIEHPEPFVVGFVTAFTAGTDHPLGNFFSTGKPCWAAAALILAGAKGYFTFSYVDASLGPQTISFMDTSSMAPDPLGFPRGVSNPILPPGLISLSFLPETTGSYECQLYLTTVP